MKRFKNGIVAIESVTGLSNSGVCRIKSQRQNDFTFCHRSGFRILNANLNTVPCLSLIELNHVKQAIMQAVAATWREGGGRGEEGGGGVRELVRPR